MAARVTQSHPDATWCCPQLPPSPRAAALLMQQLTEGWPREGMAVIGSSLGGFYARWLALQTGCRAALLNPAPFPQRDLARHIGEHPVWQNPDEHIFFRPEFVDELMVMASDISRLAPLNPATPERLFALISEQDEVLDWREMMAFCDGGSLHRLPEGDHAIADFDRHIDRLLAFLWPPLCTAAPAAATQGR